VSPVFCSRLLLGISIAGLYHHPPRLSPVFCSGLLFGISLAGLYHHPPCPMAPRVVFHYIGPVIWQQLNPKHIHSATGARYERYKRSETFADARAAGMSKMDRYIDVREGYVKKGRQLFDGELNSTVRGASAPVIAVSQGEGDSSDGGSPTHEATPRSELLVSSDGSSYAAPSVGLAPDVWIARARPGVLTESMRVKKNTGGRQAYMRLKLYNFDPMAPRLMLRYKGPVIWQQLNERIAGTASHARYERYKSSRTFADALAAGMRNHDRSVDVHRGYVKADGCF
jgi:hypothetical protein